MNIDKNISLVRTLFNPQSGFASCVEPSRHRATELVPGAQLQVVRYDQERDDLVYQVFAIGWRHPSTTKLDNRMSFRGWALPQNLLAGAKLTRWCLAKQADERITQRINDALRQNMAELKGEVAVEASFAKPLAYHPQGLVEYQDFRSEAQILITRTHPGADAFNVLVPEALQTQGYSMIESLEKVTVQNTKLDLSGFSDWVAVQTDSLCQTALGVDMLVSVKECEAIHQAHLARQGERRAKQDRLHRAHADARERQQVLERAQAQPVATGHTEAEAPDFQAEG